jgi:very-short-patch-repair endonuclease
MVKNQTDERGRFVKGMIPWNKGTKGLMPAPWNKGLTKLTDVRVFRMGRRISKSLLGRCLAETQKRGISFALKGIPKSHKHCVNISKAKMGSKNPNYGITLSKEEVSMRLARQTPSSLELKMMRIIDENKLPYRFVGNGNFFIENKCPDFVNCNGEKIALEVFYREHKNQFRGNVNGWMQNRQKLFNKYGWKVMFFDETQVNDDFVMRRLG